VIAACPSCLAYLRFDPRARPPAGISNLDTKQQQRCFVYSGSVPGEGGPRSSAFAGMRVTGEECPAGLGDKLCPRRMWSACRFPLKFAPRRAPECAGMRRNAPECAGMRRNAARTHGARVHVAEHAQNPKLAAGLPAAPAPPPGSPGPIYGKPKTSPGRRYRDME